MSRFTVRYQAAGRSWVEIPCRQPGIAAELFADAVEMLGRGNRGGTAEIRDETGRQVDHAVVRPGQDQEAGCAPLD